MELSSDPHNGFEEEGSMDDTIFSGVFLLERHDSEASLLGSECILEGFYSNLAILDESRFGLHVKLGGEGLGSCFVQGCAGLGRVVDNLIDIMLAWGYRKGNWV